MDGAIPGEGCEMSVRDMLMAATADSGAYRYWRIFIESNYGDTNFTSVSEVELRAAIGGPDVTTTATLVTASSYHIGSPAPPNLVVDNVHPSYGWISQDGVFPHWLRFDLVVPVKIKSVAISSSTINGAYRAPKDFRIEGSNDGVNFTLLKSFVAAAWGVSETKTFDI
jgi:hypothetical protein